MRRMGIEALYRKPNTSKKHPAHAVFPYLLRGLSIERANKSGRWTSPHVPMARGFVFLTAVLIGTAAESSLIGCRSRWRPTSAWRRCRAIAKYGVPEIMNTDGVASRRPIHRRAASAGDRAAWTVAASGATTSSSSGCGRA